MKSFFTIVILIFLSLLLLNGCAEINNEEKFNDFNNTDSNGEVFTEVPPVPTGLDLDNEVPSELPI